jgi:hypothetical protein
MVATLFSSSAATLDNRTFGLLHSLLALVGFAVVAHRAYELSTFDARAFADAFPVSYAPPVGKKAKNAPSFGVVDVSEFAPVVLVTAGWALLYYAFLFDQSATAFVVLKDAKRKAKMEGKPMPQLSDVKYGRYSKSARVRASDRTVGNYLEQSVPFLVSLWAHAAFVSPVNAAAVGWTWIAFRFVYPWAYRMRFPGVFISTVPAYACVAYLLEEVVRCALKI